MADDSLLDFENIDLIIGQGQTGRLGIADNNLHDMVAIINNFLSLQVIDALKMLPADTNGRELSAFYKSP